MLSDDVHYVVTVDQATVPEGLVPTADGQGQDRGSDSSTGSAQSAALVNDGDADLTLDFGFIRPSVSVGDYVWEDVNRDGLQDETDLPLRGVALTVSRSDAAAVKLADGSDAKLTTTTDARGRYSFEGLQALPAGTFYVVTVTAPQGYEPTISQAGEDRGRDSSSGSAQSGDLTADGDRDPRLDFGFVKPEAVPTPEPSAVPSVEPSAVPSVEPSAVPSVQSSAGPQAPAAPTPGSTGGKSSLAKTGATIAVPLLLAGGLLSGGALLVRRRQGEEA